jgi:STE24 endopeptidase
MRLRKLALLFCLTLPLSLPAHASETPTEHAASVAAAQEMAAAPIHGNLPDYSLPPDELVKAQHLAQLGIVLQVGRILWGIAQLALLLWLGGIAWMRDKAVRATPNRWGQCFAFFGLFVFAQFLLNLPLSLYGHNLALGYGLSVQHWGSWFGDKAKSLAIQWTIGSLGTMLIFNRIRKYPKRWWLVCWAISIPLVIGGIFITPYVIDPLFNKFEPLQKTNPALVEQLERVVAKGDMDIPPERMFFMKASAKVTTMNAYVTGFGASKRVVVWDTSLIKGTPDEVLFIFGHESGHYVLNHIVRGVSLGIAGILVALYLGYHFIQWSLKRFGTQWRISSQDDLGALAVLLLASTIISAVGQPIQSTISRHMEHDADVYGQEAVHGIVADPQKTARGAFQVLGESSFDEPNPSPLTEIWLDDHPATGRRAAFAAHYDPWATDAAPKYFPKQ